jgi:transposase
VAAGRARHDPGKVVLDLAVAIALGGDCLADVAVVRAQPDGFGGVASDPTVSRLITALAADAPAALAALRAARAAARARVWQLLVRAQAPQLLILPGCGVLTAAKLLGETANPARFRSEACFAMHAGVAPIPASSGRTDRHRLARGGNRQLNAGLHRIAVTQIRLDGLGQVYYQRRRAQGNTTMEALRALKRRLARVVFHLLRPTDTAAGTCLPAAA